MSKSLLAVVLLPLVACSAKNAKPEYAASEASDVNTEQQDSQQQDSHLYEPDDGTTVANGGDTMGDATGDTMDHGSAGTMDHATGVTTDGGVSNDVTAQAERTFADQMIAHHEEGIQMAKLAQQRAEHQELKQLAANMVTKQEAQLSELKMLTQGDANGQLGSDDGLEDLHGQLNTTRSPAPSSDATAMNDGVQPSTPDGLTTPSGADKTASATGDEDKTAGNTGAMPSDDASTTAQTGRDVPGQDVSPSGPSAPGEDMTAANGDDAGGKADVSKDLESLAAAEYVDEAFLDAMIQHHEQGIAMARAVSPRLEGEAKQLADAIVQSQSEEVAKMKGWQQAWFEADTVSSNM